MEAGAAPAPHPIDTVTGVVRWLVGVAAATAVVMLFTLEGAPADPTEQRDAELTLGASIYAERCATCHGSDGQGNSGPRLAGTVEILHPDPATQAAVIAAGRLAMPAFGDELDAAEIDAVVEFTRRGFG